MILQNLLQNVFPNILIIDFRLYVFNYHSCQLFGQKNIFQIKKVKKSIRYTKNLKLHFYTFGLQKYFIGVKKRTRKNWKF